jgi:type I restriction enzyme S subunit
VNKKPLVVEKASNKYQMVAENSGLRKCYKQNEVGVFPEDWDISLLDQLAKRGSGHTPDKKHPEYWNGSIKWISLKDSDVLDNLYIENTDSTITPIGIANSSAVVHPAGTVVLSRDAGVGKSAITKCDMAVSQHFMAWQCGSQLDNHFLYHWLQSMKSEFERIAMGSTIKTIGLSYFRELKIPCPPLTEQTAIATALSDVDALLAKLDQLITKKRDLKQATMQQLLTGQTRLPGFSDEWEVKRLGDLLYGFQNGYGFSANGYIRDGIPIVTMAQIGLDGSFQFDESKVNYWESSQLNILKNFLLNNGDVIIAMTDVTPNKNLIGRMCIVKTHQPLEMNQRVGHLRIDRTRVNSLFLINLSNQKNWRNYSIGVASLGVQANIGTKDILNGIFKLPSIEEQTAIANILSDMDTEITALETRRDKTRDLKQGMMQELLTGRIRLI